MNGIPGGGSSGKPPRLLLPYMLERLRELIVDVVAVVVGVEYEEKISEMGDSAAESARVRAGIVC